MNGERISERVAEMLRMQESLNRQVHPDWRRQRFPWHRAIWVECAEFVSHCGYKWWQDRPASPNREQLVLELVDIWHFGMSACLQAGTLAQATQTLSAPFADPDPAGLDESPLTAAEALARQALDSQALDSQPFPVAAFCATMRAVGCTFDELFLHYVAKHALNRLRQNQGDANGGYRRRWQGREDNEHLAELLVELSSAGWERDPQALGALIYTSLQERYERSSPTHS